MRLRGPESVWDHGRRAVSTATTHTIQDNPSEVKCRSRPLHKFRPLSRSFTFPLGLIGFKETGLQSHHIAREVHHELSGRALSPRPAQCSGRLCRLWRRFSPCVLQVELPWLPSLPSLLSIQSRTWPGPRRRGAIAQKRAGRRLNCPYPDSPVFGPLPLIAGLQPFASRPSPRAPCPKFEMPVFPPPARLDRVSEIVSADLGNGSRICAQGASGPTKAPRVLSDQGGRGVHQRSAPQLACWRARRVPAYRSGGNSS